MNRVQFQPGLSMAEFMQRFGSDDKCEAALVAARWPSGFACPACGGAARTSFRREGRLYWQCAACQHQCSVTYHAIKFAKYAQRYLSEVQYRFNRRYDLRAILSRLVRACRGHFADARGCHSWC
jgi:ribosomal protein L37AE/L43A